MAVRLIPLDRPEIRLLNYERADWVEFYLEAEGISGLFGIDMSTAILFYVASEEGKREILGSLGYPPDTTTVNLVVELSVGTCSYKIRGALGLARILECIREDTRNRL